MTSQSQLVELIAQPKEAYAVELKEWFDPRVPEGVARIAKACMALRNNDGGFLLIGFDNATGDSIRNDLGSEPKVLFTQDAVQEIVSKYASEPFEILVHFVQRGPIEHPVIEVESGVKTPVAARSDLSAGGKTLVQADEVYVRTLHSNGRISTSPARWKDWPRIIEICMNNREADIGRFLRRHIGAIKAEDLLHLVGTLKSSLPEGPSEVERLQKWLDFGAARFQAVLDSRLSDMVLRGKWEFATVVSPMRDGRPADREFIEGILTRNPRYTGWPIWLDSRGFAENSRPYVFDNGWEAFIQRDGKEWFRQSVDFWRVEPSGNFYHLRALEDDMMNPSETAPVPGKYVDYTLVILRVAEALAVAREYYVALGYPVDQTTIHCVARWTGLRGRILHAWSSREYYHEPGEQAQQDQVMATTSLPLSTPTTALPPVVSECVQQLTRIFGGVSIPDDVIEHLTAKLLSRRL